MLPFQLLIAALGGWLQREQADVIAFLREENRLLKARLAGQRLRFDDGERRRLAELGHRLGRRLLAQVATIVTPDTILRWHRELVARKWTYRAGRGRPAGLQAHLRALVIRMATENPTWGYTRIQGALKNLGHRVGRSTIARILRAEGIPPGRQRPMTWRTFRAGALAGARGGGLLHDGGVDRARPGDVLHGVRASNVQSRRVQVIGCTPYPDEAFVIQCLRQVTGEPSGSSAKDGFCSAIAIRSGAAGWSSGLARLASAWCGHRRVRRTATRTRSGSSGR